MGIYETKILTLLKSRYSSTKTALNFSTPLELLVATILSAQCTDKRVNIVTQSLFKKYKNAQDYASAKNLVDDIKSINFYNNKAKNIQNAGKMLVEKFGGRVPDTMDELLQLPGVARKTANVVLFNCFGKNEGVVVDTHVQRIANRLGLTDQKDPKKIERDLMGRFERKDWGKLANLLVYLGRDTCVARSPKCEECILMGICPYYKKLKSGNAS